MRSMLIAVLFGFSVALVGDYRREHLFTLGPSLEAFRHYQELITDCDHEIAQYLKQFASKVDPPGSHVAIERRVQTEDERAALRPKDSSPPHPNARVKKERLVSSAYMPSPLPRQVQWSMFARRSPLSAAFPVKKSGQLLQLFFRGLLSVHSRYGLHARGVAMRPFTSKAPTASLPPPPFRLLPGGANQFPGGSFTR